jgi:predicted negative regulator of RcsB-dependent stress response
LLAGLGERMTAKAHFQQLLEAGSPRLAAEATIELAKLAYADDNADAAIDGLREVCDSGDAEVAPAAAHVLGDVLTAEGRIAEGREAYRRAIGRQP